MLELKQAIQKYGVVKSDSILDVSRFLNGIVDPQLMEAIGKDFAHHFGSLEYDAFVTVESSGIAPSVFAALHANKPLIIIKKSDKLLDDQFAQRACHSYTKKYDYYLSVKKEMIHEKRLLLIDDFLASGAVVENVKALLEANCSQLVGVGICITKGFQDGYKTLQSKGFPVYSQAIINSMDSLTGQVDFFE